MSKTESVFYTSIRPRVFMQKMWEWQLDHGGGNWETKYFYGSYSRVKDKTLYHMIHPTLESRGITKPMLAMGARFGKIASRFESGEWDEQELGFALVRHTNKKSNRRRIWHIRKATPAVPEKEQPSLDGWTLRDAVNALDPVKEAPGNGFEGELLSLIQRHLKTRERNADTELLSGLAGIARQSGRVLAELDNQISSMHKLASQARMYQSDLETLIRDHETLSKQLPLKEAQSC